MTDDRPTDPSLQSAPRTEPSRRDALTAIVAGAASLVTACGASSARGQRTSPRAGEPMSDVAALSADHTPLPLPFTPSALLGISERMITSHHENNYGGAVRNLNRVEQELAQIGPDTPPLVVAALRERELTFRNSKALHEAYFGNLGGDGRRSGAIDAALAAAYGTTARWEEHVRATAMGLGGGSGWVVLALELETGALRSIGSGHHTQALGTSVPLLVMDMYEHSYQMDFGAAVPRYIDAFFANLNWDEVNRRLEAGRAAEAALRSARS